MPNRLSSAEALPFSGNDLRRNVWPVSGAGWPCVAAGRGSVTESEEVAGWLPVSGVEAGNGAAGRPARDRRLGASVHHAAFLGGNGQQTATRSIPVAALSHDERFAVYDVAEDRSSGDAVADFGDLRAAVGCRYVCDVVPKADGTGAILGAGAQE